MSFNPQLQITDAGMAAMINADNDGVSAKVAEIAFGSGPGYNPQSSASALAHERERTPITGSYRVGENAFSVRGRIEPTSNLSYTIREIGIFLDDGTLLAIWSHPTIALTGRGPGASFEFAYVLNFSAAPIGSVEIHTTPGGDKVLGVLAAHTIAIARLTAAERQRTISEMEAA